VPKAPSRSSENWLLSALQANDEEAAALDVLSQPRELGVAQQPAAGLG